MFQNPLGGSLVSASAKPAVVLTVAAPPLVPVPDVVGRPLDAARRVLEGSRLRSTARGMPAFSFARVISQNPSAGTPVVPAETVVTLTLNMGATGWPTIIAGMLLAAAGAVVAASKAKMKHGRGTPRLIRTRVQYDPGTQEIQVGPEGILHGILRSPDVRLRPVGDRGSPDIGAPERLLSMGEEQDHVKP